MNDEHTGTQTRRSLAQNPASYLSGSERNRDGHDCVDRFWSKDHEKQFYDEQYVEEDEWWLCDFRSVNSGFWLDS
jgi:hypothetical protein